MKEQLAPLLTNLVKQEVVPLLITRVSILKQVVGAPAGLFLIIKGLYFLWPIIKTVTDRCCGIIRTNLPLISVNVFNIR